MTRQFRSVAVIAVIAASAMGASALAGKVKAGPVKGATYTGVVHSETISVKVAGNGKTAKVSLPSAPGFCQGGSGPERQSSKPGPVSKNGGLTVKIGYSSASGSDHKQFATVTIKGFFYTFSGEKPVFQGVVKSHFAAAGSKSCDGQESFQATKL
jgi:hypothetical protein